MVDEFIFVLRMISLISNALGLYYLISIFL